MERMSLTGARVFAAVLLLSATCFAQEAIYFDCPPTARASAEEERAVRAATGDYLASLQKKKWEHLSTLGLETQNRFQMPAPGLNLSLGLMQDLLQPLKVEALTFTVDKVELKPCEALVRYTLNLRAVDPKTGKPALAFNSLGRTLHWNRFRCKCPPKDVTAWMIRRDTADVDDLPGALAAAKTPHERKFLLLGEPDDRLEALTNTFARRGFALLSEGKHPEAFEQFRLTQHVLDEMKYHAAHWTRMMSGVLERALEKARAEKNREQEASTLKSLGDIYLQLGDGERALRFYGDGLRLYDVGKASSEVAEIYKNVATIHRDQGDNARALDFFRKSYDQYKLLTSGGDGETEGFDKDDFDFVILNLAILYQLQGGGPADQLHEELLRRAGKGTVEEAGMLTVIGLLQSLQGNVSKAIEYLERSAKLARELEGKAKSDEREEAKDDEEYMRFLPSFFLSMAYLQQNDYTSAGRHFQRVRDFLASSDNEDIPKELNLMLEGIFYGSQGHEALGLSRTRLLLSNAIAQMQGGQGKDEEAASVPDFLNAVAVTYIMRGDSKTALKWFTYVLELAGERGDKFLLAQTHQKIAQIHQESNEHGEALEHYNQSLRLIEGVKQPFGFRLTGAREMTINVWRNIGRIHAAQGNYVEALKSYQKILDYKGPEKGHDLIKVSENSVQYEVAEIYYAQGRYVETLAAVKRAIEAVSTSGARNELWQLHTLAGRSHRALEQQAAALRSFEEAIREIESGRSKVVGGERIQERFFEDKLAPYHELVGMLVDQNRCADALGYAERSKSRVLLDVLRGGRKDFSKIVTPAELEQERSLRRRLIISNHQITEARGKRADGQTLEQLRASRVEARLDYEVFRANLALAHPELNEHAARPPEVIRDAEVGDLLPSAQGALLEFVVTESKTYLFVLTADGAQGGGDAGGRERAQRGRCQAYTLNVGRGELAEQVNDFRNRVAHAHGIFEQPARKLYDRLLRPAAEALAGKSALVIVPDGVLWGLPFQALKSSPTRYLLQDSAVYYAPSLTTLREMKRVRSERGMRRTRAAAGGITPARGTADGPTLLVIGNPEARGAGALPRLPETERLAGLLSQLYGPARSKVFVGASADEGRIKSEAKGYEVIHIGAHGILDDDDPMYSHVVLSQKEATPRASGVPAATRAAGQNGGDDDGFLEAWEIMDLELNANLVVLSACETGRGRVGDGEGIIGLTWALFMAGSPTSVVSQWKVDERSTTELMLNFHRNSKAQASAAGDPPSTAESLRQAALALVKESNYQHPFYWAGFTVVGDGGR